MSAWRTPRGGFEAQRAFYGMGRAVEELSRKYPVQGYKRKKIVELSWLLSAKCRDLKLLQVSDSKPITYVDIPS